MPQETLVWLQKWFQQRSGDVEKDLTKLAGTDYFAAGYIDSAGIVTLIVDLEDKFKIALSTDAYEDPRFSTVGGLAEIVESLCTGA